MKLPSITPPTTVILCLPCYVCRAMNLQVKSGCLICKQKSRKGTRLRLVIGSLDTDQNANPPSCYCLTCTVQWDKCFEHLSPDTG